jgi:phosphoribosylamine-glycine ligase
VLAITAVGTTLGEAQRLSREYADRVDLPGKQYRGDIGWRELSRGA